MGIFGLFSIHVNPFIKHHKLVGAHNHNFDFIMIHGALVGLLHTQTITKQTIRRTKLKKVSVLGVTVDSSKFRYF